MKKYSPHVLFAVGISFASVTAQAALVVNWGGDYVTGNVNFARGATASSEAYLGGTGRSKYALWDESTVLSPGSSYSGTSDVFYGGYFASHDGTATSAANITTSMRIQNNGTADQIYSRRQTPVDATKTATVTGFGAAWLKADFLSLSDQTLGLDDTSSLSISLQTATSGSQTRWLVKNDDQWYISNTFYNTAGTKTLSGASLTSETWLQFNPSTSMIQPSGTYTSVSLSDITAVGFFTWHSATGTASTTFDLTTTAFSANLVPIPEPSTYALLAGLGVLGLVGIRRRIRR